MFLSSPFVLSFDTCCRFSFTDTIPQVSDAVTCAVASARAFRATSKTRRARDARSAMLAHAPAMTTVFIDVEFRFVSGGFERVVEGDDLRTGKIVVLRHLHEEGWESSFWYLRHVRKTRRKSEQRSSDARSHPG